MAGSPAMTRLVESLKRLPGIGEKSATRLTFFLLSAPDHFAAEIADALVRLKRETVLCEGCYDLTDRTPCRLCADDQRDDSVICVVEEPRDLLAIEASGQFRGRYHVLGGALSPLDGVGPEHLRITELERRVRGGGVREVIFATNPNAEGEATAEFIAERIRGAGISLTRIACGMPLGGDLEYADHVTVAKSIENRLKIN
ncbi:MAG: recombination protein RecR [Myxococcales bacterium]|nr:recombination protein RecR [Myxococcales bacterium]